MRLSIVALMLASVGFYCYWDISFLPLLAASVGGNFIIGKQVAQAKEAGADTTAKRWMVWGVCLNLATLVFFKYFDFLLLNLGYLGLPVTPIGIALPIGISFFTFTQIAYLVDCRVGKVGEYKLENYGLFVTYFPHLIAGPILHHKDMMPQFDRASSHVFAQGRLVLGMLFFLIGLFKKVILADGVAQFVAPVFDQHMEHLSALEAWGGALAYTFQLYFDFSAYSDMAYGLSYMFGIVLPINFNSPYKSASIIEFWRRWHITLSTFLRDYLYISLGGNRYGSLRRYLNLLLTMLLGGLWHGANWTFVIWGALHGIYLIINHSARHLLGERNGLAYRIGGALLTFGAVVVGWVFFRATSFHGAVMVLQAMAGGVWSHQAAPAQPGVVAPVIQFGACAGWLVCCAVIAFFTPNAYQLLGFGLQPEREARLGGRLGAFVLGATLVLCLLLLAISETRGVSEFLYFNF